jgi:hypothetical protein
MNNTQSNKGASKLPSIKEAITQHAKSQNSIYYLITEYSALTGNRSIVTTIYDRKVSAARHETFVTFSERLRELLRADALNNEKNNRKKYDLRIDLVVDNGCKISRYPIESYSQPYHAYGRSIEKRILNSNGYFI